MNDRCPLGGPRCDRGICDCFIDRFPDDPLGVRPEAFTVGPPEPQRVRLISTHGDEIAPDRIVYLGPDPEQGTHVFEAWFPGDVDIPWPPNMTIGVLPGHTSVHIRFDDTAREDA